MHEGMEADSLHPSSHLRSDVISSVWVCITHHITFLQCWVKSCGAGTGTDYFPANIQNKNTANIYPFPLSLIPTFTLLIFIMRFPCPDFDFISMFAQSGPRTRAARVRFLQNCRARVPGCCQGEGGREMLISRPTFCKNKTKYWSIPGSSCLAWPTYSPYSSHYHIPERA